MSEIKDFEQCPNCKEREMKQGEIGKDDAGVHFRIYRCGVCGLEEYDYDDPDANWEDEVSRTEYRGRERD